MRRKYFFVVGFLLVLIGYVKAQRVRSTYKTPEDSEAEFTQSYETTQPSIFTIDVTTPTLNKMVNGNVRILNGTNQSALIFRVGDKRYILNATALD
mgnify:CR=1 FL=1